MGGEDLSAELHAVREEIEDLIWLRDHESVDIDLTLYERLCHREVELLSVLRQGSC